MKESTRNLIVGLTVVVALSIFGVMTLVFQEMPSLFRLGYTLRVQFPDTGGVTKGADVSLAGKRVGHVMDVQFADPNDLTKGIMFLVAMDRDVRLPGNVNFYAQSKGLMGGASIEVRQDNRPPGTERKDPRTGLTLAIIPHDDSLVIQGAEPEPGAGGLLPPDVLSEAKTAMKNINHLSKTLDTFFTPPATRPSAPTSEPATPNIYVTLGKFDRVLDSANAIIGDQANQENLKTSLANLRELTQTLVADAGQMGKLFSTLNAAAIKIDQGEGTFGKLINDPGLYNTMVDAAGGLKGVINQFAQLAEQWKRQGVGVKLK